MAGPAGSASGTLLFRRRRRSAPVTHQKPPQGVGGRTHRVSCRPLAVGGGLGHTNAMTAQELRSLPPGARLVYVFGHGDGEEHHQARVVAHGPGYTSVVVYFTTKPQALIRWSMATNRPIGTKEHIGAVRLEM